MNQSANESFDTQVRMSANKKMCDEGLDDSLIIISATFPKRSLDPATPSTSNSPQPVKRRFTTVAERSIADDLPDFSNDVPNLSNDVPDFSTAVTSTPRADRDAATPGAEMTDPLDGNHSFVQELCGVQRPPNYDDMFQEYRRELLARNTEKEVRLLTDLQTAQEKREKIQRYRGIINRRLNQMDEVAAIEIVDLELMLSFTRDFASRFPKTPPQ